MSDDQNTNNVVFLTKDRLEELTNELNERRSVIRKKIAEQLEYAKSLGDLSENAEYHQARQEQAENESRILELEEMLKTVQIISASKDKSVVSVGSTVVVKKRNSSSEQKFQIVGSEDVDIEAGRISYNSPLGEALIGKKKGDDVLFQSPGGGQHYTVVDIV